MWLLLLLSAFAEDRKTEVAWRKPFGIGAHLGVPFSFTAKWWIDEKSGVAAHVGFYFANYFEGRVQYERWLVELADWPFGDFGLYVDGGLTTRAWLNPIWRGTAQIGPHAGVGVDLRFKDYPVEVYAEVNGQVLLLSSPPGGPLVGIAAGPGARYYF
ncbi:MAG: hypothetical protein H6737_07340 [Alphaproteobacteria bacterium]|nr:hypothetical protein [Alphaproteobacteria bacterium]